jgi:serine/threonine protein kinase
VENDSKSDESTLADLISLWQRRRAEGDTATPAELCRDRPDLMPELERRLAALHKLNALAGAMHETAVTASEATPSHEPSTLVTAGGSGPDLPPSLFVGHEIPGYEILGELGRGAMGIVYRARQRGLNRIVALKMILHAGHAGESALQRFRAEAEAVARLRHPGIVHIYEIGEHDGLPYFSLEFCPGGSLDGQLDGTPLPPQKAAALVAQLAQAIHAAHRAGVVHRDLKPANVLLLEDGSLKISDFGLAKRLDSDQAQTASGAVMGTPCYMAPEQALGQVRMIGPATDVYALGAILYELLTGRPPFRGMTTADTLLQAANDEPVPPRRLQPGVPRDLETICLKCLQKQAARRYDSALSLADDLGRFTAGEPIRARPVGPLERVLRWARRSPRVASLTAAVLTLLLLLLIGSLLATLHIADSRDHERMQREKAEELAEYNRQLAERNAELADKEREAANTAKSAAGVLAQLFEASDPVGVMNGYASSSPRSAGERQSLREMLDRAVPDVRQRFSHQPAILALLLDSIGNAYRSLGLYEQAHPLLRDALALRSDPSDAGRLDRAESLHHLAWWHHEKGEYEPAEKLYREALALRVQVLQTEDHLLIAASKFSLAWLLAEVGEAEEPERLLREVIAVRRRLLESGHREIGIAQIGLAAVLIDRQRHAEAVPLILAGGQTLLRQEGAGRLGEAVTQFQLGVGARAAGWLGQAESSLQRCLKLTRQVLGEQHIYVALVLNELATTQEQRGDLAGAEKTFRECLDVVRAQVGLTHPKAVHPVAGLAGVLAERGRASEGEQLFREFRQANEKRYGKDNVRVAAALTAHAAFLSHRDVRRSAQVRQEADAAFRKSNGVRTRVFALNLGSWAYACWQLGQHEKAEKLAREAVPLFERHFGRDSLSVVNLLDTLALALIDQKRYQEAESFSQKALALCSKHPLARQERLNVLDTLGRSHGRRGDWISAERYYREALDLARKEYGKNPTNLAYHLQNLANVLAERRAFSQAVPLFAEVVAVWEKDKAKHERERGDALCDLALAHLGSGDVEKYQHHCRELLRRPDGRTDLRSAERIGRTLCMRSDSVADWDAVIALTASLANSSVRSDAAVIRAAVLYRAGRFTEACKLLRTSAPRSGTESPIAKLLLALCRHHLEPNASARHALDQILVELMQHVPASWQEKLLVESLRRDAEAFLASGRSR